MQKTCVSIWLWVKKFFIKLAMQMCFTLYMWNLSVSDSLPLEHFGAFYRFSVGQEFQLGLWVFLFVCFILCKDICSTWLSTLAAVQFPLTSMNSIVKPKYNPLFAPEPARESWTQTCSLRMPSANSPEARGYGQQPPLWGKYTSSSSLSLPCWLMVVSPRSHAVVV